MVVINSKTYENFIEDISDLMDHKNTEKINNLFKNMKGENRSSYSKFLQLLYKKKPNNLKYLLIKWNKTTETFQNIEIICAYLLKNWICDDKTLKYIFRELIPYGYNSLMDYIIGDHNFDMLMQRLKFVYDIENNTSLITTLQHKLIDSDYNSDKTISAYNWSLHNNSDYAETPKWVGLAENESSVYLNKILIGTSKDGKEIYPEDKGDNKYLDFLTDIEQNVPNSFRTWGPENPHSEVSCSVNDAPCRMLLCMCNQPDHTDDWFKGHCDICEMKLKSKSSAVRYPLKSGGFSGEYCSFKCMLVVAENERMPSISSMKTDLNYFGIMDRDSF